MNSRFKSALDCRGIAFVEFAVMLPLIIALVIAVSTYGNTLRRNLLIETASAAGARAAALQPSGVQPSDLSKIALCAAQRYLYGSPISVLPLPYSVAVEPVTINYNYTATGGNITPVIRNAIKVTVSSPGGLFSAASSTTAVLEDTNSAVTMELPSSGLC